MKMNRLLFLTAALGLATTLAGLAQTYAPEPTALDLARKGNDYVGIQSKDKLMRIHSDKSLGSLTPNVWHVVYYDPDAAFKAVEVSFGGGAEMEVTHPARPFQMPFSQRDILDKLKLKVDSDRALTIAGSHPLLKSLTLTASKLSLEDSDGGPVWTVELWAAKLHKPQKSADIGTLVISANDGSVVKYDLKLGRVD